MLRLGLKLFADNTHLAAEARQLLDEGVFSYIELYVPPGTYEDSIATWRQCGGPYVIHAPHWGHGVNLADASLCESNRTLLRDAQRFADALAADYIIVHGGFGGNLEEVARQLAALDEVRLAVENVPCHGVGGQQTTANTPEHLETLLRAGAVRHTVLDMGHAIYAANALYLPWEAVVRRFLALNPRLFHLSDGDGASCVDVHMSIGCGNFDVKFLLRCLPQGAAVTLETPRRDLHSLAEAREDACKLHALCPEGEHA